MATVEGKECANFINYGSCKFGTRCRNLHAKRTDLMDPPRWILSEFREGKYHVPCESYSFEEVRYSFYTLSGTTQEMYNLTEKWNECVKKNLAIYREKVDEMAQKYRRLLSYSGRNVDIRDPANRRLFLDEIDVHTMYRREEEPRRMEYSAGQIPRNPPF